MAVWLPSGTPDTVIRGMLLDGQDVLLGPGSFTVTRPWVLPFTAGRLLGSGRTKTDLSLAANYPAGLPAILSPTGNAAKIGGFRIQGQWGGGYGPSTPGYSSPSHRLASFTTAAIQIGGYGPIPNQGTVCYDGVIQDVEINYFDTGVMIGGESGVCASEWKVEDFKLNGCRAVAQIYGGGNSLNFRFVNGYWAGCDTGVQCWSGGNVRIRDCGCSLSGSNANGSLQPYALLCGWADRYTVDGFRSETSPSGCAVLVGQTHSTIRIANLWSNYPGQAVTGRYAVAMSGGTTVSIDSCDLLDCGFAIGYVNSGDPVADLFITASRCSGAIASPYLLSGTGKWRVYPEALSVNSANGVENLGGLLANGTVLGTSATSYTISQADDGASLNTTSGSAVTVSLPNNCPVGFRILVRQMGAGVVTFSAGAGATRVNRQGQYRTAGQYATCFLEVEANSNGTSALWVVSGDTQA